MSHTIRITIYKMCDTFLNHLIQSKKIGSVCCIRNSAGCNLWITLWKRYSSSNRCMVMIYPKCMFGNSCQVIYDQLYGPYSCRDVNQNKAHNCLTHNTPIFRFTDCHGLSFTSDFDNEIQYNCDCFHHNVDKSSKENKDEKGGIEGTSYNDDGIIINN